MKIRARLCGRPHLVAETSLPPRHPAVQGTRFAEDGQAVVLLLSKIFCFFLLPPRVSAFMLSSIQTSRSVRHKFACSGHEKTQIWSNGTWNIG